MNNDKEESYLKRLEREFTDKERQELERLAASIRKPKVPAWSQGPLKPKPEPKSWRQLLAMFWVYLGTKLDHPDRYLAGKVHSLQSFKRPRGDDLALWVTVGVMVAVPLILFTALGMAYIA